MHVKDYLVSRFPDLELVPSIYGNWHTGIHMELGGDIINCWTMTSSIWIASISSIIKH
ncbi:hypothetical protein SAMN05421663_11545 [Terribacillus halophilus]|uniref:Uncharacterized protein n=1 Tax=Terribacillus halophilus TaxID=361279 RepID=A0A1G6WB07_9BACI|nr:hypothetical protein [Terribacillus halophilus]SDD62255.1 hypothetical protein SAMN05421663_11545 [Terribacillus halophilus]